MIKFNSSNVNPIDNLNLLASVLGGQVSSGNTFGFFQLDKAFGRGNISITKVSSDISVIIFDITLNTDLELIFNGDSNKVIDFMFCLEGSIYHKFGSNSTYSLIDFRQNTIINRSNTSNSTIKLPANVPLKTSIISYYPNYEDLENKNISDVRLNAFNIVSEVYAKENYKYLGRVCFRTSSFVSDMMKYGSHNAAEILFKEAAILNTMASQIDRHDQDVSSEKEKAPIKKYEIDKILALETFISNNLSEHLTIQKLESVSGLNASKLQVGFKYLYNKTINTFVTDKRLEMAGRLILESDFNVSELVYSVGFTSRSYFSKIFKKYYGVSPSKCITNPNLLSLI